MNKHLVESANKMLQRMQGPKPEPKPPDGEVKKYKDFKEVFEGRDAVITLHNGTTVKGRILESRPYWIKVQTDSGVLYINKAFIVLVKVV
ncbi:MAG: hypothetical protein QXX69_03595 [Sulfolobales archaeon]